MFYMVPMGFLGLFRVECCLVSLSGHCGTERSSVLLTFGTFQATFINDIMYVHNTSARIEGVT